MRPPTAAQTEPRHLRPPPERFYWAVLDVSALPRARLVTSRRRRERLGYLFEEVLPVPIEHVQPAYLPLKDGRLLACAADHEFVQQCLADGAVRLSPADLPAFINADADPARIDLLTGPHRPPALRRLDRLGATLAVALALACTALIAIGIERRIAGLNDQRRAVAQATADLYAQALPAAPPGSQPASVRLASELRILERTRRGAGPGLQPPRDLAPDLAALLAAWPADKPIRAESVALNPASITITTLAPAHEHAQALAAALAAVPGWTLQQPQVTAVRGGVRATLRLSPAEGARP